MNEDFRFWNAVFLLAGFTVIVLWSDLKYKRKRRHLAATAPELLFYSHDEDVEFVLAVMKCAAVVIVDGIVFFSICG